MNCRFSGNKAYYCYTTTISNNTATIYSKRCISCYYNLHRLVPAVFLNHILALFVVVFLVVMSTFDPHWHGGTVDTDLLDQQHTNTQTDMVAKNNRSPTSQIRNAKTNIKTTNARSLLVSVNTNSKEGQRWLFMLKGVYNDCALQHV